MAHDRVFDHLRHFLRVDNEVTAEVRGMFVATDHPIGKGPFAEIDFGQTVLNPASRGLSNLDLGPYGERVLVLRQEIAIGATFRLGAGRIVAFGSREGLVGAQTEQGCAEAQFPIFGDLFLNSIAWLVPPDTFQYDPEQAAFKSVDVDCEETSSALNCIGESVAGTGVIRFLGEGPRDSDFLFLFGVEIPPIPFAGCELVVGPIPPPFFCGRFNFRGETVIDAPLVSLDGLQVTLTTQLVSFLPSGAVETSNGVTIDIR